MKTFLHLTILALLLLLFTPAWAQERQPWRNSDAVTAHRDLRPGEQARGYLLNTREVKSILSSSPYRSLSGPAGNVGETMTFPSPEGTMETYRVVRTRVLSEGLAAKFPGIRSYQGTSVSHPGRYIYFSMDNSGFHGMIREGSKSWYLNPVSADSETIYLASKAQLNPFSYECRTEGKVVAETWKRSNTQLRSFNDGTLRTFRLALACTGEYAIYHINKAGLSNGTDTQKKAAVLSAMNTTMTRVNGIFENDLALTTVIIDNNDEIIFLDPDTDGLTNNDGSSLLNEIQSVIDGIIGFNNYDMGHVFSTGGGGIAQVASPCTLNKARGVTGLSTPEGDLFSIDFVAHEMGHQLGATHTFNNSCNENRTSFTAVEPGSGSTIMAYAGICPPNITGQSDDYFHAISIQQIWENITNGNSTCAAQSALNNTPPGLTAPSSYVIPAGTPFVLQADAFDAEGDPLTYCWEQQDNEITTQPPTSTATEGPVFRSRPPTASPNRYFPNPGAILNNDLAPEWEPLPTVSRDLNYSILVRDNNPVGGQTARGDTSIEVVDTGAPFRVTSQSTPATLQASETQTITWEVGSTTEEPINTTLVDIYLVIAGDLDNPVMIEEDTPNDGSQQVVIPAEVSTSNARIMVKADNNIFFALNQATLSVQQSAFALDIPTLEYDVCQPDALEIPFTYLTYSGFNENTTFTATNVSAGLDISFSSNSAINNNTNIIATVANTGAATTGSNGFTLVATASGGTVREYPITINIYNDSFDIPLLLSPPTGSTEIVENTALTWETTANTTDYLVEIATDAGFTNLEETATTQTGSYIPKLLKPDTPYFWRVTPTNDCGQGTPSAAFNFRTIPVNTATYENNTPVDIPSTGPQTVTSKILVDREGDLNKLRVGVDISHSYIQDLTLTLTAPNGTTITLIEQPCGADSDIDVIFDDEGTPFSCGDSPAISGIILPREELEAFKSGPILGTWTLTVIDDFDMDGGRINSFSLEIFVNGEFKNDSDGDGVFDDVDECPDTPQGDKVDIRGCTIFSLPTSNYRIRTEGESCINNEDGTIEITTEQDLDYTATLTGNGINESLNFSGSATFNGLSAGNYELCFTVGGQPQYEQCFQVAIDEPEPLSVLSRADTQARTLELELSGGELYFIELNGVISTTTESRINLSLKDGINTLSVSTTKACQGIYKEEFIVGNGVRVYPNPVGNTLNVTTSERNSNLRIAIYSITGRLTMEKNMNTDRSGHAETTVSALPPGVYLLEISGEKTKKTIKLIKQ